MSESQQSRECAEEGVRSLEKMEAHQVLKVTWARQRGEAGAGPGLPQLSEFRGRKAAADRERVGMFSLLLMGQGGRSPVNSRAG